MRKSYSIAEVLAAYLGHFPEDAESLELLQEQLAAGEDLGEANKHGHLTAGGVVLNSDRTAVLMVHHRKHGKWFQPGGHVETEDVSVLTAAQRELQEETGQADLEQIILFGDPNLPIAIDTYLIPARPSEAEHYHHDFKYVFVAERDEIIPELKALHAVEWVPLADERTKAVGAAMRRLHELKLV